MKRVGHTIALLFISAAIVACTPLHNRDDESLSSENCGGHTRSVSASRSLLQIAGVMLFLPGQTEGQKIPAARVCFEYGNAEDGVAVGTWHVDWIADISNFDIEESACVGAYERLIDNGGVLRVDFQNLGIQLGYRSYDDVLVVYFEVDDYGQHRLRWQYFDSAGYFCGGDATAFYR